MPLDPRAFRNALGCFATGVAVATTRGPDGAPGGLTVNSFTSVSLDPPLVLFCVDRSASTLPLFRASGVFAVNVLGEDQRALSNRFAKAEGDRFAGVPHRIGANGCPLLDGAIATVECTLQETIEGGDHLILLGAVTDLSWHPGRPLLYFRGAYAEIGVDHG